MSTDYGHPDRAFFKIFELVGLGRHFGLNFFEAFGVLSARLSAPIWHSDFLVHVFHYSTIISTKN